MKKLIVLSCFLSYAIFAFAQSKQLDVSYNKIQLKLDNELKHMLEASDFLSLKLKIETELKLNVEDIEVYLDGDFQDFGKKIQLVEINPSETRIWKTYELIFRLDNDKDIANVRFSLKNGLMTHIMQLQFYKKKSNLDISINWKTPIQANREDKTGIETILSTYVVNLEVNSSEPLLENNFKILLNDIYQKNKVSPRKIDAKSVLGKNGKTIYQYNYTCEIKLHEGINKVKLELTPKHFVPNQDKFYSSVLYLNKVVD